MKVQTMNAKLSYEFCCGYSVLDANGEAKEKIHMNQKSNYEVLG